MSAVSAIPTAADLVAAWERGADRSSAERALLLIATVRREPVEELSRRPLGWVARELLNLRAALLGRSMTCLADCPACRTVVETEVAIDALTAALHGAAEAPEAGYRLQQNDYELHFRLPTSADMLALHGEPDAAAAALARALVSRASRADTALPIDEIPPYVRDALETAVAAADPLSNIELELVCPACATAWREPLDVTDFVWTEISACARRLLCEVARLAAAFGWSESEILAMSAARRRLYLGLVAA